MGFNKKQHLQQNIDALRIAFTLEKEKRQATVGERLLMMQYSGFGGLKFVLNPIANDIDINHWRKTEHDLFQLRRSSTNYSKKIQQTISSTANMLIV